MQIVKVPSGLNFTSPESGTDSFQLTTSLNSTAPVATNEEGGVLDVLWTVPLGKSWVGMAAGGSDCVPVRALSSHCWRELMRYSADQREGKHRQALQLSHSLCFDILTHQDHYSFLGKKHFAVTSLLFFWTYQCTFGALWNSYHWEIILLLELSVSTVELFVPFSTPQPHTHQLFFFLLLRSMANWEKSIIPDHHYKDFPTIQQDWL